MRIDGFIFDVDGTLIDSIGVWNECDRIFLQRHGIEYSPDISEKLKTMTLTDSAQYMKERFSLPESEQDILDEITQIVRDTYAHDIPLLPGAYDLLSLLHRAGIPVCIATANSRELTLSAFRRNGIDTLIDFIITTDEAGSGKDRPDIFRLCAQRMGTVPANTAVIEDSPHSAATAHEDGFISVGTDSKVYGDYEAMAECTDIRIPTLEDLIGLIIPKKGYVCINGV